MENAGRVNDGPSKSRGMKMQDMKITDQVAGHENDGPSKSQGVKMQDMKMQDMKTQDMKMQDMKFPTPICLFTIQLSWGYDDD